MKLFLLALLSLALLVSPAAAYQASISVPNGSGASVRSNMNNAFQAITTQQGGSTAPSVTYPYMLWMDTSTIPRTLRMRDGGNTAWSVLGTYDDSANTFTAANVLPLSGGTLTGPLTVDGTITFGESQQFLMSTKFATGTDGSNLFIGGGGQSVAYDGTNSAAGSYNTASGRSALYSNTTGYSNTASGQAALYSNTSGYFNTASGQAALYSNTTGYSNTASGQGALQTNTTGYDNTASGRSALYSNTSGYFNTASGAEAGHYINSGAANQTSNNSVYVGYNTRGSADGDTNEIVIGANATGNGSNSVTLGGTGITKTVLQGNVSTTGTISASNLSTTGTISASNLTSGTYTPTELLAVNTSSWVIYPCQYMRVGNVVTVSGEIIIAPSVANSYTAVTLSLPVPSFFTQSYQLGGAGAQGMNTDSGAARIFADITYHGAQIRFYTTVVTSQIFNFSYTYQVL